MQVELRRFAGGARGRPGRAAGRRGHTDTMEEHVVAWASRPFDLDRAATFRPVLFTSSEVRSELLLAVHHSFSDGWSTTVLVRDLGELYRAALTGTAPDLPELTADYVDFAEWE